MVIHIYKVLLRSACIKLYITHQSRIQTGSTRELHFRLLALKEILPDNCRISTFSFSAPNFMQPCWPLTRSFPSKTNFFESTIACTHPHQKTLMHNLPSALCSQKIFNLCTKKEKTCTYEFTQIMCMLGYNFYGFYFIHLFQLQRLLHSIF